MRPPFLPLALCIFFLSGIASASAPSSTHAQPAWRAFALRLTGESEFIRARAIHDLRAVPNLPSVLKEALKGENKFLALDSIAALRLEEMVPDLVKGANSDDSGFSYIALNSFLDGKKDLLELYKKRVGESSTPNAGRVVLLDTLGRMLIPLEKSKLEHLLTSGTPEVESAALYYIRSLWAQQRAQDYLSLIPRGLNAKAYQVRAQAWFFISELPLPEKEKFKGLAEACEKEPQVKVQSVCRIALKGEAQ